DGARAVELAEHAEGGRGRGAAPDELLPTPARHLGAAPLDLGEGARPDQVESFRNFWRAEVAGMGALAVIGMDPHQQRETWYVYEYFEGVYETDLARFPSWETVIDWMRAAGFQNVERRLIERIIDHKTSATVLDDPFLQKHTSSQLALLSDTAYAEGVQRIKTAVAKAQAAGKTLSFPTELIMEMVCGTHL
ncbi:MAG: hypothetical protein ACK2UI_12115, partial [Anaerolineae bacterium]